MRQRAIQRQCPLRQGSSVKRRRWRIQTMNFGQRQGPYRAVRGAVRRVNQLLKRNEQRTETEEEKGIERPPTPQPKVLLRVRTRCSTKIKEYEETGIRLRDYLSLPFSEYNLLDPDWIQPAPNKDDSTFRLTVPVRTLLGIDTGDVVADIRVRPDYRRNTVTMLVEGVTFGREELDKALSLRCRAFVFTSSSRWSWMPSRTPYREVDTFLDNFNDLAKIRSEGVSLIEMDSKDAAPVPAPEEDRLSVESYDAFQIETQPQQSCTESERSVAAQEASECEVDENFVRLNLAVQLRLNILIPPFLKPIPRALLGALGRILVRTFQLSLSSNVLEMLAADYAAWATNSPRSVQQHGGLFRIKDLDGEDVGDVR